VHANPQTDTQIDHPMCSNMFSIKPHRSVRYVGLRCVEKLAVRTNTLHPAFNYSAETARKSCLLRACAVAEIKPGQIRLGEHSDYCTMSLVFQRDVGGLQVIPGKQGDVVCSSARQRADVGPTSERDVGPTP